MLNPSAGDNDGVSHHRVCLFSCLDDHARHHCRSSLTDCSQFESCPRPAPSDLSAYPPTPATLPCCTLHSFSFPLHMPPMCTPALRCAEQWSHPCDFWYLRPDSHSIVSTAVTPACRVRFFLQHRCRCSTCDCHRVCASSRLTPVVQRCSPIVHAVSARGNSRHPLFPSPVDDADVV